MRCAGFLSLAVIHVVINPLWADPCGMVPPVLLDDTTPITRMGLQKTYVFYRDGMETFVIRPGFEGKAEEFGMLIPFPQPPAIRKMPDNIFSHIDQAIDPPEVVVDLTPPQAPSDPSESSPPPPAPAKNGGPPLMINAVRVVREEAVGMYEVAVLEAGSAAALKRWMDDHGYKFPTGMDAVCNEYVKIRWCFVVVKTRVGRKQGVEPKPGMRKVKPGLPSGSAFDGHVQAMGFRFYSKELVVPMRLSAFNEGELRNVVYVLTDGPRRIRSVPEEYVVRQISGAELYRNVTGPLPLRVIGGTVEEIPKWRRTSLKRQRDPNPHNGGAKELFASDLLAVKQGRLSHPHEEAEKMLLRVGERFGLRGPEIDRLNNNALKEDRMKAVAAAVADLKKTTLTVLDGDFPRDVLARQNLKFAEYRMQSRRNSRLMYDATLHQPGRPRSGIRSREAISMLDRHRNSHRVGQWNRPNRLGWGFAIALAAFALSVGILGRRKR